MIDTKNAIQSLKNNKAPSLDNIAVELLKKGEEALHIKLSQLLLIWRREERPTALETGNIIPVHK